MTQTTEELLDAVLIQLNNIQSLLKKSNLGFHPFRGKRADYVYVKAQEGGKGVWCRLDGAKGEKPSERYLDSVTENSVTGILVDILLTDVQTSFGISVKLDIVLDTGENTPLIIRSGATTFAEGVLRALMCTKIIENPITITPIRADKSEKAIFVDVMMSGEMLLLEKDMPRLITWENGDKARRGEILATFLPAVNIVRDKLGLNSLDQPVARQDNSQTAPIDRKSEVIALIDQYQLSGQKVTTLIEDNFGKTATIGKMTTDQFNRLKELIKNLSLIATN